MELAQKRGNIKDERRRHPRLPGTGMVGHIKVDGELLLGVPVENISLGGAHLEVDQPGRPPRNVLLELGRPGEPGLKLVGRVIEVITRETATRRRTKVGLRVRFSHMRDDVRARLYGLMEPADTAPAEMEEPAAALEAAPAPAPAPEPQLWAREEFDFSCDSLAGDDLELETDPDAGLPAAAAGQELSEKERELEDLRAQLRAEQSRALESAERARDLEEFLEYLQGRFARA